MGTCIATKHAINIGSNTAELPAISVTRMMLATYSKNRKGHQVGLFGCLLVGGSRTAHRALTMPLICLRVTLCLA